MSHITQALSLLATESWNAEDPATTDHWRDLALKARAELDRLRTENDGLRIRDELRIGRCIGCGAPADGSNVEMERLRTELAELQSAYDRALAERDEARLEAGRLQAENEQINEIGYQRRMETGE